MVEDCLSGNAKSQRRLFQRFAGKMMTVCRRYACDQAEAEDMLQDAFIKVFTNCTQLSVSIAHPESIFRLAA